MIKYPFKLVASKKEDTRGLTETQTFDNPAKPRPKQPGVLFSFCFFEPFLG